ncbi:hypothetical protein I6N91_04265 [Arthrobacter sp. MSA 4-2]|uniref:hypothetical protein n=1 Tax=Arthrobacter sp. MSA 4-2 TaxID=2794349 RepID=UPI0018E7FF97|nr:hypothetical protein [Arthrobacter sp. MSA 4-2]MBJ2120192.1 hypothetical protein [Arthrobacter sp. MSA 4-2]
MTEDSKNRTAGVGAQPDAATALSSADASGGASTADTAVVKQAAGKSTGKSTGKSAATSAATSAGKSTGTSTVADPAAGAATTAVRPSPVAEGPYSSSKAVLGRFTLREVVLLASVAVIFLGTLLPFFRGEVRYANFWNTLPLFFVGIGILLPVAAAALVIGRRQGASGLRVGSFSVDQFASIAAALAAAFFFLQTMTAFHIGPLVSLIGAVGMLAATVLAPHLPFFAKDFKERTETPAHAVARAVLPTQPKAPKAPKAPKPAKEEKAKEEKVTQHSVEVPVSGAAQQATASGAAGSTPAPQAHGGLQAAAGAAGGATAAAAASPSAGAAGQPSGRTSADGAGDPAAGPRQAQTPDSGTPDSATAGAGASSDAQTRVHPVTEASPRQQETISATRSADEEQVVEAFWFAVGTPRPVVDEQSGRQLFIVQPGDWEVGIEDRGTEFLVQDKRTGQIGVMRNLTNIERAPRE